MTARARRRIFYHIKRHRAMSIHPEHLAGITEQMGLLRKGEHLAVWYDLIHKDYFLLKPDKVVADGAEYVGTVAEVKSQLEGAGLRVAA